MTCCPSRSLIFWPTRRAITSPVSAGGYGTMTRMGLFGYAGGCAAPAKLESATAASASRVLIRSRVILVYGGNLQDRLKDFTAKDAKDAKETKSKNI